MHKNTLWSRFQFIYSYTNSFWKYNTQLRGWTNVFSGGFNGEDSAPRWLPMLLSAWTAAPAVSGGHAETMRLMRENTQTRSCQDGKYGGKQASTAYTSRHVFITHRITRGDSISALKIAKPRQRRRIQLRPHPHPNSPPWWNRTSSTSDSAARMHACLHAFLVLLTFPGSVQLLF